MSFRFKDWQVYKDARQFRKELRSKVIPRFPKEEKFGLSSQLKRALDSVVLNIAEGAYRSSDKDFAHFLNQSQTSLNEVVSCIDLCLDDEYITKEEADSLFDKAEALTKQLVSFGRSLKT